MGCRGRLKREYGAFVELQEHNHAPNENIETKSIFLRELKIAIQTRSGSKRDIYDSLSVL